MHRLCEQRLTSRASMLTLQADVFPRVHLKSGNILNFI